MKKIETIAGSGVPLRGNDIDTDRIIPARFLKCVTFDGLGRVVFADDITALLEKGEVHPFKDKQYENGVILAANANFGSGSSREHAPQALKRWGIEAIIAESYSEIFFGNCVSLGIPCFTADTQTVDKIQSWIENNSEGKMEISVEAKTLTLGDETINLTMADGARQQFLDGSWDARSVLIENLDKVKETAASIPYIAGF